MAIDTPQPQPLTSTETGQNRGPLAQVLASGKAWTSRLSIRRKIYLGYLLPLGIAVIGTTTGIGVGRQAYELAEQRREDVIEEVALTSQLQLQLSHLRLHQQELPAALSDSVDRAETVALLQEHVPMLAQAWDELKKDYLNNHVDETAEETLLIRHLIETYDPMVARYVERLGQEISAIAAADEADLQTLQNRLQGPRDQPTDLLIESLTEDLEALQEVALEEQVTATVELQRTQNTMLMVMLGGIALSVAIASLLAGAISRAIAQPINDVSTVAQRVTEEGNFNLRAPIRSQDETAVLAVSLNHLIQRVKQLLEEQEAATQQTLMQSEKMSSLGRMVAGVAHEINNPVNFVYGNLRHIETYASDLLDLIHTFEASIAQPTSAVEEKAADIDLPFLEEDLPKLLQSMRVGAERTRQIVLSLKNFSRLDEGEAHPLDLHECLDSTLLILNNRTKKGVTIVRNYGQASAIEGFAGSLYQVFMNLIANALDALEEQPPETPQITITTERIEGDRVQIRIADNGPGIAADHLSRIFEAFFTTKSAGIGTGLGLAITRQIIEEKHCGRITCESAPGQGTQFTLELPVRRSRPVADGLQEELVEGVAS